MDDGDLPSLTHDHLLSGSFIAPGVRKYMANACLLLIASWKLCFLVERTFLTFLGCKVLRVVSNMIATSEVTISAKVD